MRAEIHTREINFEVYFLTFKWRSLLNRQRETLKLLLLAKNTPWDFGALQ